MEFFTQGEQALPCANGDAYAVSSSLAHIARGLHNCLLFLCKRRVAVCIASKKRHAALRVLCVLRKAASHGF